MLTLDTVLSRPDGQLTAEVDGEVMMMHIESGNYFCLNQVASFIWQQLSQPATAGELCAAIEREFDVTTDQCVADTLAFLDSMVDDGLLRLS